MTTRGQQVIYDIALAVEANTGNREAVFALQQFAGVYSDGLYGPTTAGVVSFVLDRAPPPTRTGRVTPYTPLPNSVLEIVLNGYLLPLCETKVALAGMAGFASNSDETNELLLRAGLDDVSGQLLDRIAAEFDAAYDVAEGNIGGVPHVQILPGLNGSSEPEIGARSIVGWNDFADIVYAVICPPVRQPTLADVEPGETVPVDAEQAVVVQNAPTTIPPPTITRIAEPEVTVNVPPPVPVANDLHLAQEELAFAKAIDPAGKDYGVPTFAKEETGLPTVQKQTPAWVPWAIGGGMVVAGGVLIARARRKR